MLGAEKVIALYRNRQNKAWILSIFEHGLFEDVNYDFAD